MKKLLTILALTEFLAGTTLTAFAGPNGNNAATGKGQGEHGQTADNDDGIGNGPGEQKGTDGAPGQRKN